MKEIGAIFVVSISEIRTVQLAAIKRRYSQSCDSCWFSDADDNIIDKCQKDDEIKENEQSTIRPSTFIATSSSLFKSIKIHTTVTPFLPGLTSITVPSRTKPIQSTSTSVSSANQKHDVVPTENVIIVSVHKTVHEHGEIMKWIKGMTCILSVSLLWFITRRGPHLRWILRE